MYYTIVLQGPYQVYQPCMLLKAFLMCRAVVTVQFEDYVCFMHRNVSIKCAHLENDIQDVNDDVVIDRHEN